MLKCIAKIKGVAPLSYGKPQHTPEKQGEAKDAYEERTWRERMHVDADGNLFLPNTALAKAFEDTARYLSESVPGKGKATFTKHFLQGILVIDPIPVLFEGKPIKAADVQGERLFVPSDGKKGGGKRVWRIFPTVQQWEAVLTFYVVDQLLIDKPKKIEDYLGHMGTFNGFGRWAARVGGMYGRFIVVSFEYETVEIAA